jgi:thymidylate kinase
LGSGWAKVVGFVGGRAMNAKEVAPLIFLVGCDGCGKSFFANWMHTHLTKNNINSCIVWSRFNNYLSKPLLGVLRVLGHNHYEQYNGIRFGFHDFENLHLLKHIFVFLQTIDVNIATYIKIVRTAREYDSIICERGPFDSLVDVMVDINKEINYKNFIWTLSCEYTIIFIDRDYDKIIEKRPELVFDYKLNKKIYWYRKLCSILKWNYVNNNNSIEYTKKQIIKQIYK